MKKKTLYIIIIFILGLLTYYLIPEKKLPNNVTVDKIMVYKSKRQLLVFTENVLLKTYTISLGENSIGGKEFEGDKKTPEGKYYINGKNLHSGYHKSIGVSYPNSMDVSNAKKNGKSPGGDIKIHGIKNGVGAIGKFHRWFDWTKGCIALTNDEIDELYYLVKIGTPIEIYP
jgi:murein L,D-transpeptidase YafK